MVDTQQQLLKIIKKREFFMGMIKKLRLVGTGNNDKRSFYIFEKNNSFFSLFSIFLISLGFKDIKDYEYYNDDKTDINKLKNYIENFKNELYDLDVIYTQDKIIIIVRTDEGNRNKLLNSINKIST